MVMDVPSSEAISAASNGEDLTREVLTRETLEATLGFRVVDFEKYRSVFTHKSAVRATGCQSYERLEFMGDAVINFVVAKYLYDRFPDADEGFLTRVRTKLVSGKFLATLSEKLGLHRLVTMNRVAIQQGWHRNARIMEDVFESLVGCIYLDLGLMTAKTFLLAVIERYSDFEDVLRDTNYKDALMRYAQAHGMPLPEYRVLNDPQVTRRPLFYVVAVLDGTPYGHGQDVSKKGAEQRAAQQSLIRIRASAADAMIDNTKRALADETRVESARRVRRQRP